MKEDLLTALRIQRDSAREVARASRIAADEADAEYRRLDDAVEAAEMVVRDLEEFNESASGLLS
jgi:hypothetical protein